MIVIFSARARRDLIDIGDWIARDDKFAAERVVETLIDASEQLVERPLLYPLVAGNPTLHRRLVRPYLIFYRVRGNEVRIVTIRHGRRDNRKLR